MACAGFHLYATLLIKLPLLVDSFRSQWAAREKADATAVNNTLLVKDLLNLAYEQQYPSCADMIGLGNDLTLHIHKVSEQSKNGPNWCSRGHDILNFSPYGSKTQTHFYFDGTCRVSANQRQDVFSVWGFRLACMSSRYICCCHAARCSDAN